MYYDIDKYEDDIDLVYVDGPTFTKEYREEGLYYPRVMYDACRMLDKGSRVRKVITDHRFTNYVYYNDFFKETHNVRLSRFYKSIIIDEQMG